MTKKITEVLRVERKTSKNGKPYTVTHVLLDDGTEVEALGIWRKGERVNAWYDHVWQKIKLVKVLTKG